MKNKSSILLLTFLFLLTLCGFAYGLDIQDVMIVGPPNGTEFNTTDNMNISFWANVTDATQNNCSLWHIDLDNDALTLVGSMNVPNISVAADESIGSGNYSGILPSFTVNIQDYESFMFQIICNDTEGGNGSAESFNITSQNYTYEFNGKPENLSVSVNLDSTLKGRDKTFVISWADYNGTGDIWGRDNANATICNTDEFNITTGCKGTTYVTGTSNVENGTTLTYTVPMTMGGGAHEAYVFVVDDGGMTSDSYFLTFVTSSGGVTKEQLEDIYAKRRGAPLTAAPVADVDDAKPGAVRKFFGATLFKIIPVWLALIMVGAVIFFYYTTKKKK